VKGGGAPSPISYVEFSVWINSNELVVIPFSISYYTWSNLQIGMHHIDRRLDRIFCNFSYLENWSSCCVNILPRNYSDHHLLLLFSSYLVGVSKPSSSKDVEVSYGLVFLHQ